MARPRRALAMSGGGAKGSFQIGALEVLILELGYDFDIFCGVSVGSLNAAFLAQAEARPADEAGSLASLQAEFRRLRDVWLHAIKGNRSIYRKRMGGMAGIPVGGADSLHDSDPLRALLAASVDPQRLRSSGRSLRIQYGLQDIRTAEIKDIAPDREIITDALDFDPDLIRQNYEYGKAVARERFPMEI